MKKKMLISFSGGRTSAMMTKWLLDNKTDEYDFEVVFANTGHEREATLKFVKECDERFGFNTVWVETVVSDVAGDGAGAKIVNYETAYRNVRKNGIDPFEAVIAKYGISNVMNPHCSREMKGYTIRAYMREIRGHKRINYETALGFRSDEPKRLNWKKAKKEKLVYLAQFGNVTKEDVNAFWLSQPFDLETKSFYGNCILCWKKSDRKIFTTIQEGIINNDLELLAEIEWLKHIEEKYGRFIPKARMKQDKGNNAYFFYDNRSITDMIEESYDLLESDFAQDESQLINTALQLSMWDNKLDMHRGCIEACEPFSN